MDKVTVITVTRGRPGLLSRAIASVRSQDYSAYIDHLVIIDNCIETAARIAPMVLPRHRRIIPHFIQREMNEGDSDTDLRHVYPRISRLLNLGVRLADSSWVAFLDDDNEYESNHIRTLVDCAMRCDSRAAHSVRKIYHADGLPYLDSRFPWTRDLDEGARIYELLCSRGLWIRNTHILKDRAGPFGFTQFRNSTILSSRDPVFMVDTSVWLLARSLVLEHPIPEEFSEQEFIDNVAPDDKFLELLLRHRVRIVSTDLPTLRYYLGGVSNITKN
jgi:glycosyltransferase involved in cell wall biosynthesis